MGTNRKEQRGNQLVECLQLFHEFVKHGNIPPETKNQFCIPAEWIKALDPRIKEKIRTETRLDMETKGRIEKEKKADELDKKVKAKKISEADKQMELKVFDQMLENRIQNEIAKRIDKAYSYSFNLANYKSTISESQIAEWTDALKHIPPNGATSLDEVYKKLSTAKPENILPYLLKLNPVNALEADIAREYVSNLKESLVAEHSEIYKIKEILKSGAKYQKVKLGSVLEERTEILNIDDKKEYLQLTVRLWGKGVSPRGKKHGVEIQTKKQYVARDGDIIISRIDARNGAFGLVDWQLDGAIVSNEFPLFSVNPGEALKEYVLAILISPQFYQQIEVSVEGASGRRRLDTEKFLDLDIPLPSIEEQTAFVTQIDRQRALIDGVEQILKNWEIDEKVFSDLPFSELDKHLIFVSSGSTPLGGSNVYVDCDGVLFIRSQNILVNKTDLSEAVMISKDVHNKMKRTHVRKNDVFLNITGASIGRSAVMHENIEANVNQHVAILRPNDSLLPDYLSSVLNTPNLQIQIDKLQTGSSRQGLNFDQIRKLKIPYTDLENQRQIVVKLDAQLLILEGLSKIKLEAEEKINRILADVWGEEKSEPLIEAD